MGLHGVEERLGVNVQGGFCDGERDQALDEVEVVHGGEQGRAGAKVDVVEGLGGEGEEELGRKGGRGRGQ
jgi:hypothetical protein